MVVKVKNNVAMLKWVQQVNFVQIRYNLVITEREEVTMSNSIKFWNRMSGNYDKQVEKIFSNAYKKTIESTIKYLKQTDTVLDVGCGTGITTVGIANYVKEIYALDLSDKILEIAKKIVFSKKIDNIVFCQKSIFDRDFQNQNYNVIVAFNILCYIKEDDKFIKRIYDLLNDGGIFISVTDCLGEKGSIFIKLQKLLGHIGIIPKMNIYSMLELKNKINNFKFQILQSENLHNNSPNFYIVAKKISN